MTSPDTILLAHGGGGVLSQELIAGIIVPELGEEALREMGDSAMLDLPSSRLAFTTDSYIVQPLFFPGGDIGRLAVCGTANDLAVAGAKPLVISLALILEEGFPIDDLRKILQSIRAAAAESGVKIVTGDTKVLPRGEGGGLFINTSGIGVRHEGVQVSPSAAQEGDAVILSGPIANHGVTILACRHALDLETKTESDVAPLHELVERIVQTCPEVRMMRDATRGGVATVLNEIAVASNVAIEIDEARVPVEPGVARLCDLFGLDPLEVANEGKIVVVCPSGQADAVVAAIQEHPQGAGAVQVGRVIADRKGHVFLNTRVGGRRLVEMPYGESLPRIC